MIHYFSHLPILLLAMYCILFVDYVTLMFTMQHAAEKKVNCMSAKYHSFKAGPRSAVGNVSGYRCVSDCRSRGREFDPGPVPYFR